MTSCQKRTRKIFQFVGTFSFLSLFIFFIISIEHSVLASLILTAMFWLFVFTAIAIVAAVIGVAYIVSLTISYIIGKLSR